jgi:hypothetical protein
LADGPFLEMINEAKKDAKTKHVVVIEEINRGNPAQIFGEMLTLLEADKRTPTMAANREQSPHMTSLGEIELPVICYHSFGPSAQMLIVSQAKFFPFQEVLAK